ncbi:hypothetical protein NPX13_g4575 [Xylaria arbuscula]|uniref:Uncharacterized protein n=1 Tax=Xylaria arbuscula TaxID=114810 RepID=A0A9W8TM34_9PEZI|nr:hypothetical protein NPX13_g4575 [Xylaria arbuscula]
MATPAAIKFKLFGCSRQSICDSKRAEGAVAASPKLLPVEAARKLLLMACPGLLAYSCRLMVVGQPRNLGSSQAAEQQAHDVRFHPVGPPQYPPGADPRSREGVPHAAGTVPTTVTHGDYRLNASWDCTLYPEQVGMPPNKAKPYLSAEIAYGSGLSQESLSDGDPEISTTAHQ